MKLILLIITALLSCGGAFGQKQSERFRSAYEARGDKFMEVLYWLPETREVFRSYLPNHAQWVGFEKGYWKSISTESRLKILDNLGAQWDNLDEKDAIRGWERINRWDLIATQLGVMTSFVENEEDFLDWAFGDELLRPTFDWLIERRPKGFDTDHVGSSFSTGELVYFRSLLVERLLDSSSEQQYSCFARFYGQLTADQKKRADQGVAPQSATRSESKAE